MPSNYTSIIVVLSLAFAACGGAPLPTARLASSETAIKTASEVNSDGQSQIDQETAAQASLYFKLAQEERTKAQALIKSGDNKEAEGWLMRSEADAELSMALGREARAKAESRKTYDQVQEVKKAL
ncbi:MAG: hypothetical protein NVSMB1_21070 [Polyangiales bacterium]